MRGLVCVGIAVALTACAPRSTHVRSSAPVAPAEAAAYIDLQPGWRLRVITPLTKSGSYFITPKGEQKVAPSPGGLDMTLSADRDFLGYQTAYYAVRSRVRNGVRIVFVSAQNTRKGVTTPQLRPQLMLFHLPRDAKYVRLVYLARVSRADHDMAIIAARSRDLLDPFTRSVQTDPKRCVNTERTFCSWIPPGIAVQPEIPANVNGTILWKPAR